MSRQLEETIRGSTVEFRECVEICCRLRFPVAAAAMQDNRCPLCSGETRIVIKRLRIEFKTQAAASSTQNDLAVVLDNIRSAYNVGSIFRTSDGCGLNHVYLCGITPRTDHPKVLKTALGAEGSTPSSYHANGLTVTRRLKSQGYFLIALESAENAVSLFAPELALPKKPLALVVGNELSGVDPGIMEICDLAVSLPMLGRKSSLNVVVAFGIAVYTIRFGL